MSGKRQTDWESIERAYRAGQFSIREIAKSHGISDTAIRKEAKARGWERALADQVRKAVREKLVRTDGSQSGSQDQRATDEEIINSAALRGLELVQSHRRDIRQLTALSNILATRLAQVLSRDPLDGPCMGKRESPGDLLEKLTRVRARLIPLERQAYSLDAEQSEPVKIRVESDAAFAELVGALESAARSATANTRAPGAVVEDGEADTDSAG